jgi:hypothetical protein
MVRPAVMAGAADGIRTTRVGGQSLKRAPVVLRLRATSSPPLRGGGRGKLAGRNSGHPDFLKQLHQSRRRGHHRGNRRRLGAVLRGERGRLQQRQLRHQPAVPLHEQGDEWRADRQPDHDARGQRVGRCRCHSAAACSHCRARDVTGSCQSSVDTRPQNANRKSPRARPLARRRPDAPQAASPPSAVILVGSPQPSRRPDPSITTISKARPENKEIEIHSPANC